MWLCSLNRFWQEIQKFKSCKVWSCFLRNFIVAKMSKNAEIVFSIPTAKSESISIKIRQPLFWTDPYLPDLVFLHVLIIRFGISKMALVSYWIENYARWMTFCFIQDTLIGSFTNYVDKILAFFWPTTPLCWYFLW